MVFAQENLARKLITVLKYQLLLPGPALVFSLGVMDIFATVNGKIVENIPVISFGLE